MNKRSPGRAGAWIGPVLLFALLMGARGAQAATLHVLVVDPLQSAIVATSGSEPLSGSLTVAVDLPLAGASAASLADVGLGSASFGIALDPLLANPALGVLDATGVLLIPTLFLEIDDGGTTFPLAVPDATAQLTFSGDGSAIIGLSASFSFDAGASGLVDVQVVATALPEAGASGLFALLALAARRGFGRAGGAS